MSNDLDMFPQEALLPGRDRPIDYEPRKGDPNFIDDYLFEHLLEIQPRLWRATLLLVTLRELTMLQWMNTLTDKPEWNIKVNDTHIATKWKEEALSSDLDITSRMVDWCIAELRHKASLIPTDLTSSESPPPIFVYNGDIVKSDHALSPEFTQALQEAAAQFEDGIPEKRRDWYWQPGSDGKVLNVVHPDFFPLVYGRTRVLERGVAARTTLEDCIERCGEGSIAIPPNAEHEIENEGGRLDGYSRKFQWLPCEVDISGDEPRITSYINNLHPLHEKRLYRCIENIVKASIPLWDLSLVPLGRSGILFTHGSRVPYFRVEHEHAALRGMDEDKEDDKDKSEDDEDQDDNEDQDEHSDLGPIDGPLIHPEPAHDFHPLSSPPKFSLKESFRTRGLQVIVKMQNIELTPEKNTHEGGSWWRGEDRKNEHIAATSVYIYSIHNITPPSLSFKQFFDPKDAEEAISYQPGDHAWLLPIFGCSEGGIATQDIGTIQMLQGRLISFPNILLHRMDPFMLVDKTKRGWCKFVMLFLVDPHVRIVSTKDVPCQRKDWWWDAVTSTTTTTSSRSVFVRPAAVSSESSSSSITRHADPCVSSYRSEMSLLKRIPVELRYHILQNVDFPLSLQEARVLRDELVEERRKLDEEFMEFLEREGWIVSLL